MAAGRAVVVSIAVLTCCPFLLAGALASATSSDGHLQGFCQPMLFTGLADVRRLVAIARALPPSAATLQNWRSSWRSIVKEECFPAYIMKIGFYHLRPTMLSLRSSANSGAGDSIDSHRRISLWSILRCVLPHVRFVQQNCSDIDRWRVQPDLNFWFSICIRTVNVVVAKVRGKR